jgi:hypothetical protein
MGFRTPSGRGRPRLRLSYANIVSTLALFLALAGGTAYAASKLITGSQIAPGTITAKNIKARSLVAADFAKHQLPAGSRGLTGKTGATGPQGVAGQAGAPGTPGAPGAPGTPGPAGSAVAYATVALINGTATFVSSRFGFTSVTHPQTGIFCVSPRFQGSDGADIQPILSDYNTFTPPADTPLVIPSGGACSGSSYQIIFADGSGKSSGPVDPPDNQYYHSGFIIAVP